MKRIIILVVLMVLSLTFTLKATSEEFQEIELYGRLEVVIYDDFKNQKSTNLYFLNTDKEKISLYFPSEAPQFKIPIRQNVKAYGYWQDGKKNRFICNKISPLKVESSQQIEKGPPAPILGEKNVLVLLVNPSDVPPPSDFGIAEAENLVLYAPNSTNLFYQEASFNKVWLSGMAKGWRTLPKTLDEYLYYDEYGDYYFTSDYYLTSDALSLFDDEVDYNQYDIVIIVVAVKNEEYSFRPHAAPGYSYKTNDGLVELGIVYMSDIAFFELEEGSYNLQTIAHELGHALCYWSHDCGWMPDNKKICNYCEDIKNINFFGLSYYCIFVEYQDTWSVMGQLNYMLPCGMKRALAGWLDNNQILTVTSDTTIWIDQRELPSDNIKLVKIPLGYNDVDYDLYTEYYGYPTENEMFYYLEYVNPIGRFDSAQSVYTGSSNDTVLLRLNAAIGFSQDDYPLVFHAYNWFGYSYFENGNMFCDPRRGVAIKVLEKPGEGAESKVKVEIKFDHNCRENVPPVVSVTTPEPDKINPGNSVSCTVRVENNNKIDCGTKTYNLSANLPANWSAEFEDASSELTGYTRVSTNLKITVPPDAISGKYTITITAADADDQSISDTSNRVYLEVY